MGSEMCIRDSYKEIEHGKHVTTNGWADRAAAEAVIRTAQNAHTRHP